MTVKKDKLSEVLITQNCSVFTEKMVINLILSLRPKKGTNFIHLNVNNPLPNLK